MDAVKEWHYRPFLVENKPTAVQTTVTVPFYYGNAPLGAVNKISAEDAASHLRDGAAPVVPQMAKVAHIQGSVVLRITITEEGTVTGVNVVSGHPILIQAAIDAVTKWRYKPFLVENKPAAVQTIVTVPFILDTAK
jgi:TonB family protein